ncbi:Mce family protein [Gordonia sp. CNJ-863]|uniref:MlaD family protein n=1 Tax=Gordonia sp. CNJ-863 TaxID=1904963 RepID=UPI0009661687|nr:MlaD family protein [Gordonia sp. CNJ-863]OLT45678.1 Mce family protein [Gordonia sp. CNJ-863]
MTPTRLATRRLSGWLGLLIASVILCVGCSFNPSSYAMPGTGVGGPTYRLDLEFSSLLSLPAGAEVRSNGAKIGSLRSITLTDASAVAHVEVSDDVELFSGTRAELRQTSVLGDIYIALIPPAATGSQILADGDVIRLADTDPGPQIEDVLNRMADFVNAGSMSRLQDAIAELNKAMPADEAELRGMAEFGAASMGEVADNVDDLDRALKATAGLTGRLDAMRADLGFMFSDQARSRLERVPGFMTAVLNVVIDVNTLTTGLEWLIPRLPHVRANLEQLAPLIREPSPSAKQLNGNAATAVSLTKNKLVPFLLGPNVNVKRVSFTNQDVSANAFMLLKMVGAVR